MINELIEQLGRERLEFLSKAENLPELQKLAQFALAVLDAKPVGYFVNTLDDEGPGFGFMFKNDEGLPGSFPLYATPPAASVQEAIGEVRLGDFRDDGTRHAMVVCLHDQADWENFADGTKLYLRQ